MTMRRYIRKPVVDMVRAEQWFPGKDIPGVRMHQPENAVIGSRVYGTPLMEFPQAPYPVIQGVVGPIRVNEGDWILQYKNGDYGVCPNDAFHALYQLADI